MSGKTDVAKGRIKEAAGALTDNDRLRKEGKRDQAVGKIKQVVEKAVNKIKVAADGAVDKARTTGKKSSGDLS